MPTRTILGLFITVAICASAMADDKYSLHENLHVGQIVPFAITYDCKVKSTATAGGNQTVTDTDSGQSWKVTLTLQAVKDGSDTRALAQVDPESFDTNNDAGQETKTSCPFAGKTITLTRHPDESFTNDFQGAAGSDDVSMLNNFLTPDADFYPDKPVAVGDIWDNSAKLTRHLPLGPKDQLLSQCRLDWVKTIDGKQMAQVSNSVAIVLYEDGNVEEEMIYSTTNLVDLAAGMIVKCDEKGSSKYKTPATQALQVTGGTEFTFHSEYLPDAGKTAKP
ncbi:MAG: hypothetical protein ABSB33_05000 [Tepidisphaeraceae bacterium]|jgi:hypothetical protein